MAAQDLTVTIITYQHVTQIQPGNQLAKATRVSIRVGQYGPFTHDFPEGADGTEAINTWIQAKVNEVRLLTGQMT